MFGLVPLVYGEKDSGTDPQALLLRSYHICQDYGGCQCDDWDVSDEVPAQIDARTRLRTNNHT
jgi:hypothetical protein